jgi:hypothetical protein
MTTTKPAENLIEHIHDERYETRYNLQNLNHSTMIYDAGRSREQLNGRWHFSVDPYDTVCEATGTNIRRLTFRKNICPGITSLTAATC